MDSVNFELKRFAHNIGQNWYHVVLTPKYRTAVFRYADTRAAALEAFDWICKRHNFELFSKEVMPDHVHLFVSCPPDSSVRRMIQIIKGGSSYYIRRKIPALQKYQHLWNRGTMHRSIGNVNADTIKHYIEKSNRWTSGKQTRLL